MLKDVDSTALARLLDLQDHDSAIARLESRREAMPEGKRLRQMKDQLAEVESDLAIATKQGEEIAREQSRLEDEVESLGGKIGREEQRLFSGSVANPKELSALQAEVDMLKRNRALHEDTLLEVLVRRDQSTETVERLSTETKQLLAESAELGAVVDKLTTEIDGELQQHRAGRSDVAKELPEDLLRLYEQLRSQKGGVGAAALANGTCQGCHTQLPNKEVERLKSEGGLQRCDNCRRILVVV